MEELERTIDKYKVGIDPDTGAPMLSTKAMAAVKIQIKKTIQELITTSKNPAQAMLLCFYGWSSISDMAEGYQGIQQGLLVSEDTRADTRSYSDVDDG